MKDTLDFEIIPDSKGYIDRTCPNENCLYNFKINAIDWKEKIYNNVCHCPLCGYESSDNDFWTDGQKELINSNIESFLYFEANNEISKILKELEKSNRNNKYVKIKYKAGKKSELINNSIIQKDEWEQDITCSKCGTRYSVIGFAYFCPNCCYSSRINSFIETLDIIKKKINSLDEIGKIYSNKYGKDKSISIIRDMIENTLGEVLSAFQNFVHEIYKTKTNKEHRTNDFQRLDKINELLLESIGKDLRSYINQEQYEILNAYFQERHLKEHLDGFVDEKYINNVSNSGYKVGQRIVIKKDSLIEYVDIIEMLSKCILNDSKIEL